MVRTDTEKGAKGVVERGAAPTLVLGQDWVVARDVSQTCGVGKALSGSRVGGRSQARERSSALGHTRAMFVYTFALRCFRLALVVGGAKKGACPAAGWLAAGLAHEQGLPPRPCYLLPKPWAKPGCNEVGESCPCKSRHWEKARHQVGHRSGDNSVRHGVVAPPCRAVPYLASATP